MPPRNQLRLTGILTDRLLTGPQKVVVHVTNVCNLKCAYCQYHAPVRNTAGSGSRTKQELRFDLFKNIVDDCARLGTEWLQISGEGEPTLHPRIKDMVAYAKNKDLRVRLFTNGTFSQDIAKAIAAADEICVDLSACDATTYRALQSQSPKDLFSHVLRNLTFFAGLKKRGKKSPAIQINYILNSKNYKKIPALLRLASRYGVDHLNIKKINVDEKTQGLALTRRMFVDLHRILKKTRTESFYPFIKNRVQFEYSRHKIFFKTKDRPSVRACHIGWYYAYVYLNGDVTPCCKHKNTLIAGNIYKQSFREIWTSDAFRRIRHNGKYSLYGGEFEECRDCCFYKLQQEVEEQIKLFKEVTKNE